MVDFATYDDLKRFTKKSIIDFREILESSAYGKNTFLSHSSKDNELLPGVISVLENHGASVYVDNGDETLPKNPSIDTAKILRKNIKETRKFVLFVTPHSKDSVWIPWELGVADGEKTFSNVALFPSAQDSYVQSWSKQEYLGLYKRIVWSKLKGEDEPLWIVYDHHNHSGIKLREWLK